jgi:hypothetical protein
MNRLINRVDRPLLNETSSSIDSLTESLYTSSSIGELSNGTDRNGIDVFKENSWRNQ